MKILFAVMLIFGSSLALAQDGRSYVKEHVKTHLAKELENLDIIVNNDLRMYETFQEGIATNIYMKGSIHHSYSNGGYEEGIFDMFPQEIDKKGFYFLKPDHEPYCLLTYFEYDSRNSEIVVKKGEKLKTWFTRTDTRFYKAFNERSNQFYQNSISIYLNKNYNMQIDCYSPLSKSGFTKYELQRALGKNFSLVNKPVK